MCWFQLTQLQFQGLEVQKLTQEQHSLESKLDELETARTQAEDQVRTASHWILCRNVTVGLLMSGATSL